MNNRAQRWRPSCQLQALKARSVLLAELRQWFLRRHIMEVETPLLARAPGTDPHLHSPHTHLSLGGTQHQQRFYLQTSPEYAMKRLLASGSGPIYQICKSFRDSDSGRHHNPEFTMLEWYEPGSDHLQLMDRVDELLGIIIGAERARRLTYRQLYMDYAGIDPFLDSPDSIRNHAHGITKRCVELSSEACLDVILGSEIQPKLPKGALFVCDYPITQAALAIVRAGEPPVAERFELYYDGVELANGYHELLDAREFERRQQRDLRQRRRLGLPEVPLDDALMAALWSGMPACAGVSIGVDRLLMIKTGATHIDDVLAFPIHRI